MLRWFYDAFLYNHYKSNFFATSPSPLILYALANVWRLDAYETNPASSWTLWSTLVKRARLECSPRLEDEYQLLKVSLGAHHGGKQRSRTANGPTAARFAEQTPKDHSDRAESRRCKGNVRPSQCTVASVRYKHIWTRGLTDDYGLLSLSGTARTRQIASKLSCFASRWVALSRD